jgi:putative hydrolase of the HAD superfamily
MTAPTPPRPEILAVLFDLDDTLYPESTYFASGFEVVARELVSRGLSDRPEALKQRMITLHNIDRSAVLDRCSAEVPFPSAWVPELLEKFRSHDPQITLPNLTSEVLARLRTRFVIGCVTDGWIDVQKRKVAALGLESSFDALIFSDALGRPFWKPHPAPFLKCCEALGVPPGAAVFVGDNPARDILGARRAGLGAFLLAEYGTFHQQANPFGDCQRFTNLRATAEALLDIRGALAGARSGVSNH